MKTKTFDCVQMKEEAQAACEKAYGGLPLPDRRKRMIADIMADPEFAQIYRRFFRQSPGMGAEHKAGAKVAEAKADYRENGE